MDIVEIILKLPEEELEKYIQNRIQELEEETKRDKNSDSIGYLIDENYQEKLILSKEEMIDKSGCDIRCLYGSYIPKGTKIIFGSVQDQFGRIRNAGLYYYMDIDDYILEFCQMIRKTGIDDFYDFLDSVHILVNSYFGEQRKIERDKMFQLIQDSNGNYYKPKSEHGLSWFLGNGNALCSEKSAIAQNIISFFDIESYIAIGRVGIEGESAEAHAYNFVIREEEEKEKYLLVDFANGARIIDMNFNEVGTVPFIGLLNEFTEEFVDRLSSNKIKLEYDEYGFMLLGNSFQKLNYNKKRDYYLNIDLPISKNIKVKKVLTKTK